MILGADLGDHLAKAYIRKKQDWRVDPLHLLEVYFRYTIATYAELKKKVVVVYILPHEPSLIRLIGLYILYIQNEMKNKWNIYILTLLDFLISCQKRSQPAKLFICTKWSMWYTKSINLSDHRFVVHMFCKQSVKPRKVRDTAQYNSRSNLL